MLELDAFGRDRSKRDGKMRICKKCATEKAKAYYWENREAVLTKANLKRIGSTLPFPRICAKCDLPTVSQRHKYCRRHREEALEKRVSRRYRRNMTPLQLAKAKERERKRQRAWTPEKAARYGIHHQRTKASWRPIVATGTVRCPTCGQLIRVDEPWDLGHVPGGGAYDYLGPEHARCNRATAKKRVRKGREPRPRQVFVSRVL